MKKFRDYQTSENYAKEYQPSLVVGETLLEQFSCKLSDESSGFFEMEGECEKLLFSEILGVSK